MERTITVKGTGTLSLKPDQTVVSVSLSSTDKEYDKSMHDAAEKLDALAKALQAIGFQKQDLKTVGFQVTTEYESVCDADGNYRSAFKGYRCNQQLKLEFDFDTRFLSQVLSAIASCISEPELNIQFTVKDKTTVNNALLENAAQNARAKAEILAAASGVKLGRLVAIDYSWGERNVYSDTHFMMEKKCLRNTAPVDMAIVPDDITVSDTATFVWTME